MLELLREQLELLGATELFEELSAALSEDGPVTRTLSKSGPPALTWAGRSLHSRHDPLKEARRHIDEVELENDAQLVLFFGAGIGYSVRDFCERYENPVVWFEPHAAVAAHALSATDVRDVIRTGRLSFVTGMPDDDLFTRIFQGRGNRDIVFVLHRPSFQADAAYRQLRESAENFLNKKDVNLATLSRFDRSWARNLAANFVHLSHGRPVRRIFDVARETNVPALVCGAGPSLADDLDSIRAFQSKGLIIAVDTAVNVLLHGGVDPDIIVTVDPQAVNRFYLEGYFDGTLTSERRAFVLVDPTTSYLTLRMIPPERLLYAWTPFPLARLLFDHLREDVGEIAFGGSVSTNAYDLALKLGCRRIFLAGQDLSFTGGQAHTKGAVLEERLNLKEHRTFRREMHNYRQFSALPVRFLPAVLDGGARGEAPANDRLVIFHRWFQRRFAADLAGGHVDELVNTTPRGAVFDVPGLERRSLADVVQTLPGAKFSLRHILQDAPPARFDVPGFREHLAALSADFHGYAELLREAEALAEQVYARAQKGDHGAEYRQGLERLDVFDERLRSHTDMADVAGGSIQRIILRITENFRNDLEPADAADPHRAAAKQSLLLYGGLREAAEDHARWLGKSARILREG